MKSRKKGFTLIELLAVIVILAIIALIATPIILNIIEKARKSAFVDSAYGLVEAAKLEYTEGLLQNTSTAKSYSFPQTGTDNLEFSGSEPTGGTINISNSGQVSLAIHNGTWCAIKSEIDSQVTISKYDAETCVLPEIVETTPEDCFKFNSSTGTIEDYYRDEEDYCGADVVIPGTIDGVPVTAIGEYAFSENQLTSVDLTNLTNLITIEAHAFVYNQLTTVTFGENSKIEDIGRNAFCNEDWTVPTFNMNPPLVTDTDWKKCMLE